jgi:hypothetical protein
LILCGARDGLPIALLEAGALPDAGKDKKKMELVALLFILALALAVAYFFGKIALDNVVMMMIRGEEVARRVSQ